MSDSQSYTCAAELKIALRRSSNLPQPRAAHLPEPELVARGQQPSVLTPSYKNTVMFSSEAEDEGVLLLA